MSEELSWIEYYADDLGNRANWITRHTNSLLCRPPYETRAEHSLDTAEIALERALAHVRAAQEKIKSLEAA